MKKQLPLSVPPITTFPSYAAALSIMSNYEESYDWFYSQYIQLCTIEITNPYKDINTHSSYIPTFFVDIDTRRITNTFSDYYFVMRENCPYLNIFETPNELINATQESFISFIKQCINLNLYIFTFLDVSKIKQYKSLLSGFHEIFIYGYDDEKKIVHFADFPINDTFKYSHSVCDYAEIEAAYDSMNRLQYPVSKSVALIRYTNSTPYIFDLEYVRDSVRAYITPNQASAQKYNDYVMSLFKALDWNTKTYLGVDIYTFLAKHISTETQRENGTIALELFHGLYDHKEMMIKRLLYFSNKGYIDTKKQPLIQEYKKIRDNTLIIRNNIIKYFIRPNDKILEQIYSLLETTKIYEIEILKQIFELE